jgi:hypothetical protein
MKSMEETVACAITKPANIILSAPVIDNIFFLVLPHSIIDTPTQADLEVVFHI